MARLIRFSMIAALLTFATAGSAFATNHYVAANGSDSNNGTSEQTPWLHAPGMPSCTASCASYTPQAGDQFIFRGGDTWHRSANTTDSNDVYMGGQWTWSWSGSSSSCSFPDTVTPPWSGSSVTSCIYIGVDTATPWVNASICGSSFCRPRISMDNPIWTNSTHKDSAHTGFVTACSYDDYTMNAFQNSGNYTIFDNFEISGKCWTQPPIYGKSAEWYQQGTHNALTESYFHGWTEVYNPLPNGGGNEMDDASIVTGGASGANGNDYAYNVFDGTDSACGITSGASCTGGPAFQSDGYNIHHNVFRYLSNGIASPSNIYMIHDNLFEYLYESYDPSEHGNVIESEGELANTPIYIYNNTIRHVNTGVGVWPEPATVLYEFNNIVYDYGNSVNCFLVDRNTNSNSSVTVYFYNNTLDSSCAGYRLYSSHSYGFVGTFNAANNHYIGFSVLGVLSWISNEASATVVDNGGEVWQTLAIANLQGYTESNNYQPTSTSGATYHAGNNYASACSGFGPNSSDCTGSTAGTTDSAGSGATPTYYVSSPPSRGTTWDAGAYEYNGSSSGAPAAPTSLSASVQ
jgi:hypothetical protein